MAVPKSKTKVAKHLRKNETDAERLIWSKLRAGQVNNLKFRRQQPIGPYIVDFACLDKKLIVEIDGGQHNEDTVDKERDSWLTRDGYLILRFWNNDVFQNTNGVMETIREASVTPPLSPRPSSAGNDYEGELDAERSKAG